MALILPFSKGDRNDVFPEINNEWKSRVLAYWPFSSSDPYFEIVSEKSSGNNGTATSVTRLNDDCGIYVTGGIAKLTSPIAYTEPLSLIFLAQRVSGNTVLSWMSSTQSWTGLYSYGSTIYMTSTLASNFDGTLDDGTGLTAGKWYSCAISKTTNNFAGSIGRGVQRDSASANASHSSKIIGIGGINDFGGQNNLADTKIKYVGVIDGILSDDDLLKFSVNNHFIFKKSPSYFIFATNSNVNISGSASGQSTATGQASVNDFVSGSAAGVSTASSAVSVNDFVSGSANSIATATGSVNVSGANVSVAGNATSNADATGLIDVGYEILGDSQAVSTDSGVVSVNDFVSGDAQSIANATGSVSVNDNNSVSGSASGLSTATGQVNVNDFVSGAAQSVSSLSGNLGVNDIVSGNAQGVSASTGSVSVVNQGDLFGNLASVSNVSGNVSVTDFISGDLQGNSNATGTFLDDSKKRHGGYPGGVYYQDHKIVRPKSINQIIDEAIKPKKERKKTSKANKTTSLQDVKQADYSPIIEKMVNDIGYNLPLDKKIIVDKTYNNDIIINDDLLASPVAEILPISDDEALQAIYDYESDVVIKFLNKVYAYIQL